MPKDIEKTFDEWAKAQYEAGLEWLPAFYMAMVQGRITDEHWQQQRGFFDHWLRQYKKDLPEDKVKGHAAVDETDVEHLPNEHGRPDQGVDGPKTSGPAIAAGIKLRSGTPQMQAERPSLEDHLGRDALVETLADLLGYADQPPLTIALMGDWGSGKSSLVEQLQARLPRVGEEKPEHEGKAHYLFAEFNAWEYEQTDSMRAGLAQEVVKGLTGKLDRYRKFRLAVQHAYQTHGWDFVFSCLAFFIGIAGLAFGVSIASPDDADKLAETVFGTGIGGAGLFLLLKFWATTKRFLEHPLAEDMKTYLQLPSYGKHLGEVPVIKKELKNLCEARLKGEHDRLLVVVDDLDRCSATAITDTFDAVRLVIDPQDLPKVAVIIAVDDRIAFRALAKHYASMQVTEPEEGMRRVSRSKEEIARDYLSKIIQLPLRLEPPGEGDVRHFVTQALMPAEPRKLEAPAEKPTLPPISEAAQRLIDQEGLDPWQIHGEGKNGAIRQIDVQHYLKSVREHAGDLAQAYTKAAPEPEPPPAPPEAPAPEPAEQGAEPPQLTREELERVMTFEPEEQALFAELVAELRLRNPRQLIRLKNSYLVLKRYNYAHQGAISPGRVGDIEVHLDRVEELMTALCWYEYLYQSGADQRHFDELTIWFWQDNPQLMENMIEHMQQLQPLLEAGAGQVPQIEREPPAYYMGYRFSRLAGERDYRDNYVRLMREVEMVVLPNAERGLILSLKEAEAVRQVLEAKQKSGEPEPEAKAAED